MTDYSPIVVSVYNRYEHFRTCIGALLNNPQAKDSELYVVSDAPFRPEDEHAVNAIRSYIRKIDGFKKVYAIFREKNMGAFESVTQAAEDVIKTHGKIIALEDDVIVSKSFLQFMNDGLENYESNKNIFSVSAYCPPTAYREDLRGRVLVGDFHCPWGFATWEDRRPFDICRNNSYRKVLKDKYAIKLLTRHCAFMLEALRVDYLTDIGAADVRTCTQMILDRMVSIYPAVSLTRNIGVDGTGVHMGINEKLMEQQVCDGYLVSSWEPVDDRAFRSSLLANGSSWKSQIFLGTLYRLGLRDRLDALVTMARKFNRISQHE
jgi:hypothetical protein